MSFMAFCRIGETDTARLDCPEELPLQSGSVWKAGCEGYLGRLVATVEAEEIWYILIG